MPWHIGIDEAGYGPNLGPLVMTAVACRAPGRGAPGGGDLWKALRRGVCRHLEPGDPRLHVNDSKEVYSPGKGLRELERSVLGIVWGGPIEPDAQARDPTRGADYARACAAGSTLSGLVASVALPDHGLDRECWYAGGTALPIETQEIAAAATRFHDACAKVGIVWGPVCAVIVCPARFNELAEKWNTKAVVLGLGMADLMRRQRHLPPADEPLRFIIDKHGGRNHYSALLQHAWEEAPVLAREEGSQRSVYEVLGLTRDVTITFQPRAEAASFCVALASMVSKYLREVLMLEFNRFWQQQVPGLTPTAGYPGDAARFFAEIQPAMHRLGIEPASIWRTR